MGNDTATTLNLTYTANNTQCVLQPFDDAATYGSSFKSKILAIEGVDLMSNANGHDTAGTILTGSTIEGGKPKNSSLDQYMAVERKLGMATRVTSVAVGVGDDAQQAGTSLSFGPGGAPLPEIIDPVQAFDTLPPASPHQRSGRGCGGDAQPRQGPQRHRLSSRTSTA